VAAELSKHNCYDNAYAESFWSRLKTELLADGSFRNLAEARLEISRLQHLTKANLEMRVASCLAHSAG
jgi:putative transposase